MPPKNPQLPDGTWAVTKEDKEIIVDFGRKLSKFIFDYAKAAAKDGKFHTKIVAGGFQYFMDMQKQKAALVGDDILIAQVALEQYNLGPKITEPFTDVEEIPEETKEEKIERLKKELAEAEAPEQTDNTDPLPLDEPVSDPEVDDASIAPSSSQQ